MANRPSLQTLLGVGAPVSTGGGTITQNGTTVSNVVGITGILPAMSWNAGDLVCVAAFGNTSSTVITGASDGGGTLNAWSRMYDGGAGGNMGLHSAFNNASDGNGNGIDCWVAVANAPSGSPQVITVSGAPFYALVGFVLSNANNSVQHGSGSPAVDAITQLIANGGTFTPSPVTTTQTSQVLLLAVSSNGASSGAGFTTVPSGYTTIVNGAVNGGSAQSNYYIGLQTVPHSGSGTISPGGLVGVGPPDFSSSDTIALVGM